MAKAIWSESGAWYWFHYCRPDNAVVIGTSRTYEVSSRDDSRGNGLHLTRFCPGAKSDTDLLKLLFALQRDVSFIEGVVVLRPDDKLLPAQQYGSGKWLVPKNRGEIIDLTTVYLGHGRRDDRVWTFTGSLFL